MVYWDCRTGSKLVTTFVHRLYNIIFTLALVLADLGLDANI